MTLFLFPLMNAKNEPPAWKEQLENFMLKDQTMTTEMINNLYCFALTVYDHGIEIVSDKLTRPSVEETARRLAVRFGLD